MGLIERDDLDNDPGQFPLEPLQALIKLLILSLRLLRPFCLHQREPFTEPVRRHDMRYFRSINSRPDST